MNSPTAIAIIPARYQSTRLPGKPIIEVGGKSLIQHVYDRVKQARTISRIIVATDDHRIARTVEKFGGEVAMTRADHQSGTDRLAEVAETLETNCLIANVQGDEPMIEPEVIDRAVAAASGDAEIVTLMTPLLDQVDVQNPNRVKVVSSESGMALYFSRLPIPKNGPWFLHLGLYVYRRDFLRTFSKLQRTALEISEQLEQLRALEHGYRIRVVQVDSESWGIDTPADVDRFNKIMSEVIARG